MTTKAWEERVGAMTDLTEAQKSLLALERITLYITADLREIDIRLAAHERGEALDSAYMRQYRQEQEAQPLATDYPYRTWIYTYIWIDAANIPAELRGLTSLDPGRTGETAYMVHCFEEHPRCGGIKTAVGPGHFKCSVCGVEVRLG